MWVHPIRVTRKPTDPKLGPNTAPLPDIKVFAPSHGCGSKLYLRSFLNDKSYVTMNTICDNGLTLVHDNRMFPRLGSNEDEQPCLELDLKGYNLRFWL